VVALRPPKLATLLTLAFTGLLGTAVVAFALVLRFGIEANFQTYLDAAQAAAHARIMGALSGVPGAAAPDRALAADLGRQALDLGVVLTIRDGAGTVVWDARSAEAARVDRVFHDLEGRLQARSPWEHGWWAATDHPLGSGGTMTVEVFEPRRLGASDLAFLQGIDALLAALAAGGLALAVLLGSLTSRAVVRPLGRVQKTLHRLAEGDHTLPSPVRTAFAEGRDLEASLGTLTTRLARLQALRDTAGADTAHELRTPLANLAAQLEALEDGVLAPEPGRFETLGAEVRRLLALVETWEDLERARTRQVSALPCADPGAMVRRAAEVFQARAGAQGQTLAIFVEGVPGPLPLDEGSLGRIVTNLVENAHRHTPAGGRIEVTLGQSSGRVTLTVDDNGPGIPPDHRDAVFDRFYRVDPSRSRGSGGLGLGLSLVKALVGGAGGSVAAEDSPLGGCRIRVVF
jgi:two-component system sensor histidine kinase BaeS